MKPKSPEDWRNLSEEEFAELKAESIHHLDREQWNRLREVRARLTAFQCTQHPRAKAQDTATANVEQARIWESFKRHPRECCGQRFHNPAIFVHHIRTAHRRHMTIEDAENSERDAMESDR